MRKGLNLEVVWFDQDMVELLVSCCNGYFAGQAEVYVSHDRLMEVRSSLLGFPSSPGDSRTVELGTFNPDHANGGLRMRFYCTGSSGRPVIDMKLRGGGCKGLGEVAYVALCMRVEPAAIDSFLSELKAMEATLGAAAHLAMAT